MSERTSVDGPEHVHDLLSEYLNGDLPDAERQVIQQHLDACARCRRDYESLRLTVNLVRQIPLQAVPRSFAIAAPEPRQSWRLRWLRLSTSALAAVFVALLALRLVLPSAIQPAASTAATGESRVQSQAASASNAQPAAAAPTAAPAAPPMQAAAAAAAPAPRAAQAAATAAPAAQVIRSAAAQPAPGATPTPASGAGVAPLAAASRAAPPGGTVSPPAVVSAAQQAAPVTAPKPALQTDAATAHRTAVSTLPPSTVPPRPATTRRVSTRLPPAPSAPDWYTPLLAAVGVLLAVSLGALVWVSRRR